MDFCLVNDDEFETELIEWNAGVVTVTKLYVKITDLEINDVYNNKIKEFFVNYWINFVE